MKRMVLILFTLLMCCNAICGTRRALLVFVGDYPSESGWNRIASQNDKRIVLRMLVDNGFRAADVTCLEEAGATYDAIISAMDKFAAEARPGDQIYVHFSCHGQQITDQDGDESLVDPKDRYDEALVPYDACVSYGWNGYKGEKHLTDDVLSEYFYRIQQAVGAKGCLLVVNDACHSGGLEMDETADTLPPHRGTFDAFEQPLKGRTAKPEARQVSWVSLSACKSFQTNYEVKVDGEMYGRLSYAMSRCFREGISADELVKAISEEYKQIPMPEGKVQTLQYVAPERSKRKAMFQND